MNADLIAVVVPCFRYGAYVEEAVDSLRRQEGGAPRTIVVDDGSDDDETHRALERLEAAPDVVVLRQRNSGVCAARNAGIAVADRPFVLCLDADDRLAPGALAALLPPLLADRSLGFTYGHPRFFGALEGVMRFPPYDPLRLLDRHLIGATALARAELLRDTGGFDPAFPHYEDWEIWVHALAHGWRGLRVDEVTVEYRRQESSKFAEDRAHYRDFRRRLACKHGDVLRRRRELARESDLSPAGRLLYRWFWGPRPLPPLVEQAVTRLMWRPAR